MKQPDASKHENVTGLLVQIEYVNQVEVIHRESAEDALSGNRICC